jgi:hypothetical protein
MMVVGMKQTIRPRMNFSAEMHGRLQGGDNKGGAWKESQAPLNANQFVEYLRDHLLLDKCVDSLQNHFYHGESLYV